MQESALVGYFLRDVALILLEIVDDALRYDAFFIHSCDVGNDEGLVQFFRGVAIHVA